MTTPEAVQAYTTFFSHQPNPLLPVQQSEKTESSGNTVFNYFFQIPASTQPTNLALHFTIPAPKVTAHSKPPEEAKASLEDKAKSGKPIPPRLQKIVDVIKKGVDWTLYGIGIVLCTLGILLLLGGTAYTCYVFGSKIGQLKEIGVFGLVSALIKTGAMPSVLFGGAMLHFGRGLMKSELSNASLLSFVTPFYGLLFPMDTGKAVNPDENPWINTK